MQPFFSTIIITKCKTLAILYTSSYGLSKLWMPHLPHRKHGCQAWFEGEILGDPHNNPRHERLW